MHTAVDCSQKMLNSFDARDFDSNKKDAFYNDLELFVRALHIAKFHDYDLNFEHLDELMRYCEWQELFEKLVKIIVSFAIRDPLHKALMRVIEYLFDHKSKMYAHFKDSQPKRSIFEENKHNDWRQ